MSIDNEITHNKIFAVIRDSNPSQIIKICKALNVGGINLIEITMESENSFDVLKSAIDNKNSEEIIGAGTVLDVSTAERVIALGAQFIVSPIVNIDIINICKLKKITCIIGAFTPTEILLAYSNGADYIKIFPATTLGTDYIKTLKGPFPNIPIIPTGGIDKNNVKEYLNASGIAVGIGSSLVNTKNLIKDEDFEELQSISAEFRKLIE